MGGLGILLLAVGAILAFATSIQVEGFDLETIGLILMVVGFLAIVLSVARGQFWGVGTGRTRSTRPRTAGERRSEGPDAPPV